MPLFGAMSTPAELAHCEVQSFETQAFADLSTCLFLFFHKVLHKNPMEIVWVLQGNQLNSLTVGTT